MNNWIAVEDRLPEPDVWVLVWVGKYHWIASIDSRFGIWVGVYENEYWRTPTHWMPLPIAPAVEGFSV